MRSRAATDRKARNARFEPLPERAERNRRRLWIYLALYVTASSALVTIALVGGTFLALLLIALRVRSFGLLELLERYTSLVPLVAVVVWMACLPAFAMWCVRAMRRPLMGLLASLSATPVGVGELADAKSALHDAVIAAGASMPRLALIDDDSVNAFVIAKDQGTAWIGVTNGLLDRLTQDELRGVFAHLVARIRDGSAVSTTVIASLFDAASRADGTGNAFVDTFAEDVSDGIAAVMLKALVSPLVFTYVVVRICLAISSVFVLLGYRHAQAVTAESADSEAMMLTKDPRGMLGALEKVLPADNRPGTVWDPHLREDVFGALFFAWPTVSFSDDSELVRIERMREVLGAAGA